MVSDNGSAYTAEQTRLFARQIGLQPVTTPVRSPQSNGMAKSFVRFCTKNIVANTAWHRPMRPSPQNFSQAYRSA